MFMLKNIKLKYTVKNIGQLGPFDVIKPTSEILTEIYV